MLALHDSSRTTRTRDGAHVSASTPTAPRPRTPRGVPPSCVLRPIHLIPTPLTRSAAVTSTPPPFPRPASTPVMRATYIHALYALPTATPPLPPPSRQTHALPPPVCVTNSNTQQQHGPAVRRRNRGLCNNSSSIRAYRASARRVPTAPRVGFPASHFSQCARAFIQLWPCAGGARRPLLTGWRCAPNMEEWPRDDVDEMPINKRPYRP